MSARSRWKYQQAPKQGLKPQIPDGADEEPLAGTEVEQTPESDSVVVPNKKGIFSFFVAIFCFFRRIIASVFAKVRSFQKSYLASITAEGPKEEEVPLFSPNEESNQEEEDPLLAQQIEATSRQLTELHQNIVSVPPEKEEEEAFDADDFDEAVRKARMKLLKTAAVVFLCIGGFCAYQFVPFRGAKEDFAASEDYNDEKPGSVPDEKDHSPFAPQTTVQLAEQNPPVANLYPMPSGFDESGGFDLDTDNYFAEDSLDLLDSLDEDDPFGVALESLALDSPMDDYGFLSGESPQDQEDEFAFASPIPAILSLEASQEVPQAPPLLQGEMEGSTITIHNSPLANLPLPQNPAPVQRAAPAPQFAAQFQESDPVSWESEEFGEEPSAPKLAAPNQRYQNSINEVAIPAPSSEPRRQRGISFGPSPVEAGVTPAVQRNDSPSQPTRQYTIQEDDNLFNIAQRELGDVTRWREIRRLNRETIGNNTGYLTPGTVIFLPK